MDRRIFPAALVLTLTLHACNAPATTPDTGPTTAITTAPATPAPAATDAGKGAQGAAAHLGAWAAAIERRDFDQAWEMLPDTDRYRWSKAEWARMFAGMDSLSVTPADGEIEGAAGSSYYTARVTITGTDQQGRRIRYAGPVVLRRVNDVPGAAPAQLRWHLESVTLDPVG